MNELTELLHDLPFVSNLWETLAGRWGSSQTQLLDRVKESLADGALREIGPMFNLDLLGYHSTLAAAAVPPDRVDAAAGIVSAHPGVSHNYLREGSPLNLWFTLAVPGTSEALAGELNQLSAAIHLPLRRFDTVTRYKISFSFHASDPITRPAIPFDQLDSEKQKLFAAAITVLQRPFPLEPFPFRRLAEGTDLSEANLLQAGEELRACGILRRFGAVWRHRQLGLAENVLCLWQLPEKQIEPFAQKILTIPHITHGYRRTTYPDWPWQLYTMLHGPDPAHCQQTIRDLLSQFPQAAALPLRTIKEYKKSRVLYTPKDF
jgi:DNA-binding Lrp family transcriptional regulator